MNIIRNRSLLVVFSLLSILLLGGCSSKPVVDNRPPKLTYKPQVPTIAANHSQKLSGKKRLQVNMVQKILTSLKSSKKWKDVPRDDLFMYAECVQKPKKKADSVSGRIVEEIDIDQEDKDGRYMDIVEIVTRECGGVSESYAQFWIYGMPNKF